MIPTVRLPKKLSTAGVYRKGHMAGFDLATQIAAEMAHKERLEVKTESRFDNWGRGHQAGMYAAMELIAEKIGVKL